MFITSTTLAKTDYHKITTQKNRTETTIFPTCFDEAIQTQQFDKNRDNSLILKILAQIARTVKSFFTTKELEPEWNKKSYWSEGLERSIDEIIVNKKVYANKELITELELIGKNVGFKVVNSRLNSDKNGMWIEDYSIRRPDGKIYIMPKMAQDNAITFKQNPIFNSALSEEYSYLYDNEKIVFGKSYLEGGNVLNTICKDGSPGAIIGLESLNYTIDAMGLKGKPEDFKIASKQIAKDLNIKEENITFITQPDFHIDMFYRPLQNGTIAVPDYQKAIEILETHKISSMDNRTKKELIEDLKAMAKKSSLSNNNKILENKGYKIKKIACFTPSRSVNSNNTINFQNAICGTGKDGSTFIITNNSKYPEINKIIETEFKNAGIDSVYFVSTDKYLLFNGGIDCLTQER